MRVRQALVLVHRWCGLAMAGFLLLAGLTGSLLAWFDELEGLISPQLHLAKPPSDNAKTLDPLVLREKVLARYPGTDVQGTWLSVKPGRSLWFFLEARPDPVTGRVAELVNDQVFLNPYTGELQGERKVGDISQGARNLMVFVYRLHYSLALDGVGTILFGIVALVWTLDCFVGAYLTFPIRSRGAQPKRPWLARWQTAWKVRWRSGSYKLNFDLHRAAGLWLWVMLFLLAWSSVAFNLPQVYRPTMRALLPSQPDMDDIPKLSTPQVTPRVGWIEARDIGRALMAKQAALRGFSVVREDWLSYDPTRAVYRYSVRSSLDLRERSGETTVMFNADTRKLEALWLPTGAASGDTVGTWLTSLHMAAVWGVPFKMFVCFLGFAVALFSVTGVIIWLKKRAARRSHFGKM